MGTWCSKGNQPPRLVNRQAYKTELGADFFASLPPSCPENAMVVVVRLRGFNDIIDSGSITAFSGPYLQLKIFPKDPIAGDQLQRSSFKPAEVNPRWVPPERFQFVSTAPAKAKILLSAYNFLPARDPETIGDCTIVLNTLHVGDEKEMKLRFVDPSNGKNLQCTVEVTVSVQTLSQAKSIVQQSVYQFQRWVPGLEWGPNFLPGEWEWSSVDGRKAGKEVEDVAPIPDKWTVTVQWHNIATEEDADGWQYATDTKSLSWFSTPDPLTRFVRRRMMVREISAPYKDSSVPQADSSAAPLLQGNGASAASRATDPNGNSSATNPLIGGNAPLTTTRGVTPGAVAKQTRRKSVL